MKLRGIQHIGVTVKDMENSVKFYTEILGGKDITHEKGYSLAGQELHNALLSHEAKAQQKGVPDLASENESEHQLDVRFIQFPNVVIELLWYHQRGDRSRSATFDAFRAETSPAYVGSMHISFEVDPEVNLNEFLKDLEERAAAGKFSGVKCNLVNGDNRVFYIGEGDFEGWALAYCKGPNGEQFEFNQVTGPIKDVFDEARAGARS